MPTLVRRVIVKIKAQTNKDDRVRALLWGEHDEDETIDEFVARIKAELEDVTDAG